MASGSKKPSNPQVLKDETKKPDDERPDNGASSASHSGPTEYKTLAEIFSSKTPRSLKSSSPVSVEGENLAQIFGQQEHNSSKTPRFLKHVGEASSSPVSVEGENLAQIFGQQEHNCSKTHGNRKPLVEASRPPVLVQGNYLPQTFEQKIHNSLKMHDNKEPVGVGEASSAPLSVKGENLGKMCVLKTLAASASKPPMGDVKEEEERDQKAT